jgi:phospholipase C
VPAFEFTEPDGTKVSVGPTSDVRAGEKLLHEVYTAIRTSASATGSNAMNTLFLVTFDEHGGTYDHLPPPAAPAPPAVADPEMGFTFDRLGVRVPAIAISAWTRAGGIIHDEMHHGAAIATLCRKYGLAPLNARDEDARDLGNAINLTAPRPVSDWPETIPPYVPPNPDARAPFTAAVGATPLTAPAKAAMGILVKKFGLPANAVPATFGEAYEALERLGRGLFG